MFLPNLQRNIQELERQISRLETECEHSVSGLGQRREIAGGGQEGGGGGGAFITGPSLSALTYAGKAGGERRRPESRGSRRGAGKGGSRGREVGREPTWCELLGEQGGASGRSPGRGRRKERESSDEGSREGGHVAACERPKESEGGGAPRSRRSRSARTRRNQPQQAAEETGGAKSLQEKETQCLLWDEKGRGEFFLSINESVKVLQGLVEELKRRPAHEKRNDVLNDMQDTLRRIIEMEDGGSRRDGQTTLKDTFAKFPESADNIMNMRNALCAVKKICEELSNEKAALAEEICVKNVALANSKAKEKEYMTLITNLKYSLEKQKEAAEEGMQVKRDLRILSVRLQEEAKVIEALKKSHEKMQELVENYVLENDRLKAQFKITKLETQKYSVLLAGKDAEIAKYKKEIESFQKQITEQLSLLRSRATESEVQKTIEAISTQASILQKDDQSELQDEDEEEADDDDEDTLDSSSVKSHTTLRVRSPPPPPRREWREEEERRASTWGCCEGGKGGAEGGRSPREAARQLELENVLNSSNRLRNSINDLLEDIKREASDVYWNSCGTSVRSNSNLTTSEGSEVTTRD